MRFAAQALLERGVRSDADLRLDGAQHAMRASAIAATASSARRSSAATGPSITYDAARAAAGGEGAVSGAGKPDARRLEVRLVRRLPALAARLRGRVARGRRARSRSPISSRRASATVGGPVRPLARRGLDHHAARRGTDPRGAPRSRSISSRSAPARRPAASRRCATSPTSTSSSRPSTPRPSTSRTLATSTPISAHVPVDFELRGCPINKRQLLEVIARLPRTGGGRTSPSTASASSASGAAPSA